MLEVKVNVVISAPELTSAVNNIATAISGKAHQTQYASTVRSDAAVSAPASTLTVPAQAVPTQPHVPAAPTVPVQQPATPIASVPLAAAPQFSIEQIMTAGATLMDAGKIDDLLNLLHSFGVQAVTDLKPEQLGAFATEMRKLGAAI